MRAIRARLLTVGVVALLATACGTWTMAGQGANRRAWDRDNTNITPANVTALAPSWNGAVTSAAEVIGDANRVLTTGPSVRGLDPATGAQKWSRTASTAVLRDSDAFIATAGSTCTLRRITASTGATTASTNFGGPAIPSNLGGMSLCSVTGTMLDSDSVVVVPWYYAAFTPAPHCANAWEWSVGLTAFDGTLAPVWTRSVSASGCGTTPSDLLTHPAFGSATRSNGHWLATHGDAVEALPTGCAGTCSPAWTQPINRPIGPIVALSKTSVAVIDAGGTVRAFDEAAGTPQWTGATGGAGGSIATTNARIFAVSGSTMSVFRAGGCGAATCTPSWTAALGTTTVTRPSIAGDVVYLAAGTNLVAYDANGCGAATCAALTTKSVTNTVTGPPTPLGSRLLVPTTAAIRTFMLPAS
jgi:hypothetical protein